MGRRGEVQRKLLEQLMGAEAMGIVTVTPSLWDPKVCRSFVAGVCTHDLFTNTKMDLGTCPRIHSPKLKNEYEAERAKAEEEKDEVKIKELNRLKVDAENEIHAFVEECDRRIRMAQRRLEKTPEENNRTLNLMREIGEIEGAHQAAMAEVELLGSEGKVEESLAQLTKAEALKSEKEEKERELQQLSETAGASGHQKLRVCDICGAYLSLLDSDRRLADHFGGRMHLGYHQLRVMQDEWRTRGPIPTGPLPSAAGGPPRTNGPGMQPPPVGAGYGAPPPHAPSGPTSFRPPPSAASGASSRPPPTVPSGPPAPGFVPAGGAASGPGSSSSRDAGRGGDDRSSSDRHRSDRDRDDRRDRSDRGDRERERDRSSRSERDRSDREPRSERDRSDRDRERERERDRDGHRSSRRGEEDRDREHHRSSRHSEDRSERSSRRAAEEEGGRSERRSSRRYDDIDEPKVSNSSSSRKLEDGEERSNDKRRKVEP